MRTKRSIRLPLQTIATLRDLRDSHIGGRPLPELVRCCLKQTEGVVNVLKGVVSAELLKVRIYNV